MATSKLNRTETAGNRQIWTFSAWVKRSSISSVDGQYLFSSSDGSNNYNYLQINQVIILIKLQINYLGIVQDIII